MKQSAFGIDDQTLKRYRRLTMQLIINKVDPLSLDDFKYSFLEHAGEDKVSVPVNIMRLIVRNVVNCEKHKYEERFIQALLGDDAKTTPAE